MYDLYHNILPNKVIAYTQRHRGRQGRPLQRVLRPPDGDALSVRPHAEKPTKCPPDGPETRCCRPGWRSIARPVRGASLRPRDPPDTKAPEGWPRCDPSAGLPCRRRDGTVSRLAPAPRLMASIMSVSSFSTGTRSMGQRRYLRQRIEIPSSSCGSTPALRQAVYPPSAAIT